jgi:autotransporter-associated beta strand protein
MKTKTLLATTVATFITCAVSQAAALTWDGAHSSTWDTTTANWSTATWVNGDAAIFGATGVGSVTIASGGVSTNSVTFNTAGYTIGGDPLTLSGAASITSNANATISAVVAGTAGLSHLGTGTLTLTSANTYSGATSVGAGRLVISGATAVAGFGSDTSVASGATLEFDASTDAELAKPSMNFTGAGTVVKSGAGTWYVGSGYGHVNFNLSAGGLLDIQGGTIQCNWGGTSFGSNLGSINLASGATLNFQGEEAQMDVLTGAGTITDTWDSGKNVTVGVSGGTGTFGGVIQQVGGHVINLIKNGSGTQTFSIRNEYYGSTTINTGRLVFDSFNSSNAYNIASGAALEFNYPSGPDSGNHSLGPATFSGSGTLVKKGNDSIVWGYGAGTFAMAAGSLIDVQAGTFVGSSNGDEVWTSNLSSLNIASGAVFRTVEGNVYVDTVTGAGTFMIGAPSDWGYVNTTIGVNGGTGTFDGTVMNDYGNGNLVKVGAGTQTLAGVNTYYGSTTINGGRLVLQNSNNSSAYNIAGGTTLEFNAVSGTIDQGTATLSGTGTLVKSGADILRWGGGAGTFALSSGALIDVQEGTFIGGSNGNEDWTSNQASLHIANGATFNGVEAMVRIDALTGAGSLLGGYGGTETITIGVAGGSGTFSGGISNNWAAFGVTKVGTGTQILTGTNTYTGTTTLTGGTLQLGDGTSGHDGSLASTSIVNNANLVFNLAGSSSYSGAISGTGTTKVKKGTLSLTATVASTATLAIDSGAVLHLPNYGYTIVSALVINGVSKPAGAYDASNTGGAITGPGVIQVGGSAPSAAYLAWTTSYSGFVDTYPTHDPDGDGMTNQQEFAFGLDPTSGASNNPIIVPLDKATGTFTYTRLAPAVSGLTYKVYTSTNLSTWTLDAGAVEDPTSLDVDVESVKVTLSDLLPLTAPKLFVRVAAE